MRNKDIKPRNTKGKPHGYWERYWSNNNLLFKCVYHNGKVIGYEEDYSRDGKLRKKTYYL